MNVAAKQQSLLCCCGRQFDKLQRQLCKILGRGEPIKNPVTGDDYRVRIDIPKGFEHLLAEIGRGWTTVSRPMQFTLADSYAQFAHVNLCQSGILR